MIVELALGVYAVALIGIALASRTPRATMEQFLVAGRKQRRILVVASMLASTIGGGITIGTVQRASAIGFPAFWFVAAGGVAHFLQGFFLSRKVRQSEALTLADLAERSAGGGARTLSSLIVVVTWTGIAAAQFVALARVLSTLVQMPHVAAVVVVAAFVGAYTLIGGQKSVLRTDLFQFGLLAIAVVAALAWLYLADAPAPGSVKVELFNASFGPLDFVYYLAVMGGSYFICPMMFSRLLSADSPETARSSSFLSGTGMFATAAVLTFIGLWVSAAGFDPAGADPLNALAARVLPRPLGVLVVFGLLAAIVSTADTVLLTAAGIIQNDLIRRPSTTGVRLWTLLIAAAGAIVAATHTDIIGLLMKTYNGYTAGLVPALAVALANAHFVDGRSTRRPDGTLFALAIVSGYILGMIGSFVPASGAAAKALPLAGMAVSALLSVAAFARGRPAPEDASL